MGARADYECKTCQATIEDLPADSILCPRCGKKRGFRRLFNKVQVSTRGHRAARFIDRQMRPAMDQHTSRQQSAKRFENAVAEAKDRIYEQATPAQRAEITAVDAKHGSTPLRAGRNIPAAAAFSMIDPIARHDSAVFNMPALKRKVVPEWQR